MSCNYSETLGLGFVAATSLRCMDVYNELQLDEMSFANSSSVSFHASTDFGGRQGCTFGWVSQ